MKSFKDICRLSQDDLKLYMHDFLASKEYNVINEDGFLYAKGTIPVLLVAHLDTVHTKPVRETKETNGIISSPQGIGGDDRCGVFIIMNLVTELKCSVLFCEDEECGGNGARKFIDTGHIKNLGVNYIVEFDRKGNEDAVFYGCDNKEFIKFITSTTGFKEDHGSFSDISVIAPAAKIAAVNLSSGYYKAHTKDEYVDYHDMMHTIEVAKKLIATESKEFKYIAKVYESEQWYPVPTKKSKPKNNSMYQQLSFDDYKIDIMASDFDLELEVVYVMEDGEENCEIVTGNTKSECWSKFFILNPDVCYNMIIDYSFC